MEEIYKESLKAHKEHKGKWATQSKVKINSKEELALYYSPGVAQPCLEIQKNPNDAYLYTNKGNNIAVITDGSAVLGLGNIGATAALPVMEGKAILFKKFADIDVLPLCLDTQDTEEIIAICKSLAPSLGGINLEDISAPRCVEIETRLKAELDIPVLHDDQHGTAVVVLAALINACKIVNKKLEDLKIVVVGTGAAGSSIIKNLSSLGIKNILAFNTKGALHKNNPAYNKYDSVDLSLLKYLSPNYQYTTGSLNEEIQGADVFIGVSAANILKENHIKSMNSNPIVFALANPYPEIIPELAKAAGAKVVGTGRSDYPNQINNMLAFPGIFRGALDAKAKKINQAMLIAATYAIAESIPANELNAEHIIPSCFDNNEVTKRVTKAVYDAAIKSKITKI